jgi:transcriptional regulator with XRE-family HTH domain
VPDRDDWDAYIADPLPVLPAPERREALRQQMGLSIEQAARKVGVSRLTFRKWETGESKPRPERHREYARMLAVWEKAISTLG